MADHYLKTLDLLDEVDDIETDLRDLYAAPYARNRPAMAAELNRRFRASVKAAEIHATLAAAQMVAQAIRDADVPLTATVYAPGLGERP